VKLVAARKNRSDSDGCGHHRSRGSTRGAFAHGSSSSNGNNSSSCERHPAIVTDFDEYSNVCRNTIAGTYRALAANGHSDIHSYIHRCAVANVHSDTNAVGDIYHDTATNIPPDIDASPNRGTLPYHNLSLRLRDNVSAKWKRKSMHERVRDVFCNHHAYAFSLTKGGN